MSELEIFGFKLGFVLVVVLIIIQVAGLEYEDVYRDTHQTQHNQTLSYDTSNTHQTQHNQTLSYDISNTYHPLVSVIGEHISVASFKR